MRTHTIQEIAEKPSLFFEYNWFLNGEKLIAVHGRDVSTEHKTTKGYTLCSLRRWQGTGAPHQASLKNDTVMVEK